MNYFFFAKALLFHIDMRCQVTRCSSVRAGVPSESEQIGTSKTTAQHGYATGKEKTIGENEEGDGRKKSEWRNSRQARIGDREREGKKWEYKSRATCKWMEDFSDFHTYLRSHLFKLISFLSLADGERWSWARARFFANEISRETIEPKGDAEVKTAQKKQSRKIFHTEIHTLSRRAWL